MSALELNETQPESLLDVALSYATRGLAVFPCKPNKQPYTAHGFKDATTDEAKVRQYWQQFPSAMIGVATGSKSGVWALDPDAPKQEGAPDGRETLQLLIAKHGPLPFTHTHATPGGGFHYLFKWRADRPINNNSTFDAQGINIRGEGGYVIAPPSRNADGKVYYFVEPMDAFTFAEAPEWLYDLILTKPACPVPSLATISGRAVSAARPRLPSNRSYAETALREETRSVALSCRGNRNNQLNTSAFNLGTLVGANELSEDEVISALYSAATGNGLVADDGDRAVKGTISSGLRKGIEKPRQIKGRDNWSAASVSIDPDAPWSEIDWSLLDDRRGELPSFPTGDMPITWQQWIDRAAHGAGVTPGHVAVPLLAIVSSLIGTGRRIQASRSWSEPCTLWTAVVGFSGTGKTPGLEASKRLLVEIEKNRAHKIAELQRKHESRVEAARAAEKKWKADVAAAVEENRQPPQKPIEATDPGEFVTPRLYASNITIERMPLLLRARPQGMLVVADELAALFLNMSRYSSGQDNEFYLECFNGKHYVVERLGRPPVVVENLLVGITGGFQPDKLARSFEGDNDGMYARILFGWPEEPPHKMLAHDVFEIDPVALNALEWLANLSTGGEGSFSPKTVPLSNEALFEFEQFRQFLHDHKQTLDGREREWCSKGATHVLRLAGTLAFLDAAMARNEPGAIEAYFLRSAVNLWRNYFWPHSRAALRQGGMTERQANARRALRWILTRKVAEVSLMDIRREALGHRIDASQTQALLETLCGSGWLRPLIEKGDGPGRPARRWEVNPRAHAGNAENAEIQ